MKLLPSSFVSSRKPCIRPGLLLLGILALGFVHSSAQTIPAFPGAQGYGAYAKGGRGGDVYYVTNLNSSGSGSLADAIATAPTIGRTIIFAVSGYIHVPGSNLRITQSKITIAGQTAPGDGIGLKDGTFRISGDDIIVRHLRFRHGKYGSGGDCIDLDSGSINAILDHISMQFSTDENISSFDSPPENLTLQWAINAWGLESHSCGGLWDQNHATCHHSLWASNHTRNPKARPAGLLEWINNVTFDWDIGFIMGDSETPATWKANVRGCYFLAPPGNQRSSALEKASLDRNGVPNFSIYLDNNLHDSDGDGLLNGTNKGYAVASGSYNTSPVPFDNTGSLSVTMDDALTTYKKVISNTGALRLDADPSRTLRDEVDTILFNKVTTQTHFHVTRESDTGASNSGFGYLNSTPAPVDSDLDGMPDYWETALGSNLGVDDHNTAFASSGGVITAATYFPASTPAGYTYLEEYLYWLSIPHGVVAKNTTSDPSFIDIDLRKYTSGFSNSATFALTNVSGGTVAIQIDGHTARFTPTVDYVGRGRFDFTVNDGQTWTQTCGVLVSASGIPKALIWKGGNAANAWDNSTNNWTKADGTAVSFGTGDFTLFDDRGSVSPTINLSTSLVPGSITVNSTQNYVFGGSGLLAGAMPLSKSGSGSLTINNTGTNSYSGGTTIAEGILFTNSTSGLGTGKVTLAGGTLNLTSAANLTMANAIAAVAPSTLKANNNTSFSGAFSGSGDLSVTSAIFTPTGTWAAYSGKLTLANSGTLRFNQGTNPWGAANAFFDAGTTGTINNRSTIVATTVTLGALQGGSSSWLRGSDQSGSVTDTYVVGGLNLDTTFDGKITDGTNATSHTTAFTKAGTGALTLTGANTYTGPTLVSAGTLTVTNSLGATAVTVNSGALLTGSGTFGGTVTANAGSFISPGTLPFTGATMNVTSGLTLNAGCTLYYDMSSSTAGANDRIVLGGGTLAMTGQLNFQFLLLEGIINPGIYDLVSGATNSTASSVVFANNLPVGSRQTFAISRPAAGSNPSYIRLTVSGNTASLLWTGATSIWDTNDVVNWTGATDGNNKFILNDAVTFNDTSTNGIVTLAGNVQPRVITMDNSSTNYTFNGTGSIVGSGSLNKSGTGTLTISPAQVSVSSTTVNGSPTVTVTSTTGLGTGMTVGGGGIPANTTILAINGTTLTLSQNATADATLTLSYYAANTYSGGTVINTGSSILLTNPAANAAGLGTGLITLNGGTLTMFKSVRFNTDAQLNAGGVPESSTFKLVVPTGQTGTLNADSRCDLYGSLSGGGILNLNIPWTRTTLYGDWSAFTGTINALTDGFTEPSGGTPVNGDLRMGTSYSFPGFPNALVALGDKVSCYYTGTLTSGAGTTIEIGDLSGVAGSSLLGGPTGGRALTYRIGRRGGQVTFAGPISEQASGDTTAIVKTGVGAWTLSGVCTYAGSTTVEQGTLRVSGSISNSAGLHVLPAASLDLQGGTLTVDNVEVDAGANLTGFGTIKGDLTNDGTISCALGGTLTITGDVVNNGTMRLTGGTILNATGAFVNNGLLDLITSGGSIPLNLVNGPTGIVLDASDVILNSYTRVGNVTTLKINSYAGHNYILQRSDSLASNSWTTVSTQAATGLELTFTYDSGSVVTKQFYRIQVSP